MKTLEQNYGVPTFKLCEKLNKYWKDKTTLVWYEDIKRNYQLGVTLTKKDVYPTANCKMDLDIYSHYTQHSISLLTFQERAFDPTPIYAPQIHELLSILPKTIKIKDSSNENQYKYYLKIVVNRGKSFCMYCDQHERVFNYKFTVQIIDNNIVEALAELYLALKKQGEILQITEH